MNLESFALRRRVIIPGTSQWVGGVPPARAFWVRHCGGLSVAKIPPVDVTTMSLGWSNRSGPNPETPALPSLMSSAPPGLNLISWWPLPFSPLASVTQRSAFRVKLRRPPELSIRRSGATVRIPSVV